MRNKKLHYLPGIISLIGLPVLLFFWGPEDPVHPASISMNMFSFTSGDPCTAPVTKDSFLTAMSHKKMVSLDMNDLVWNDQSAYVFEQKLQFITRQIASLRFTGDTGTVLRIGFGMKNDYKSIVWVLNQAMVYDLNRYVLMGDDLYVFANQPVTPRYAGSGLTDQSLLITGLQAHAKWGSLQKKWQFAVTRFKYSCRYLFEKQQQNKLLGAGFLLLILLPAIIKIRGYIRAEKPLYTLTASF